MFKSNKGINRVSSIIGKLTDAVAELQTGIEEIDVELATNREIQEAIKANNRVLGASRTQASNLARNIEEMFKCG